MAKRTFTVSDLTGEPIVSDEEVATIIVHDAPHLDHAVTLDAAKSELASLKGSKKDFVMIEVVSDGGDTSERMVIELAAFNKLFTTDVDETLAEAEHYSYGGKAPEEPKKRGRPAAASAPKTGPKVDYSDAEFAGVIHRGRITEEEAYFVRNNLDKANANRKRAGQPEIDPKDPKEAKRYNFNQNNLPNFTDADK